MGSLWQSQPVDFVAKLHWWVLCVATAPRQEAVGMPLELDLLTQPCCLRSAMLVWVHENSMQVTVSYLMETSTMLMVSGNVHDVSQHDITFIISQDKSEHIAKSWKLHSSCHNGTLIIPISTFRPQAKQFLQSTFASPGRSHNVWFGWVFHFLYPGWAPLFHSNEIIAMSNSSRTWQLRLVQVEVSPFLCWTMENLSIHMHRI